MNPDSLPRSLYTAEAVRRLDAAAIAGGTPGTRLMARAGRAAFQQLLAHWPQPACITVFCGTGNNGGDGYVLAQLAHERGLSVQVLQVGDQRRLRGEAHAAHRAARAAGVPMQRFNDQRPADGVVVDALLGTGLSGPVRIHCRQAIAAINASGLPVLALDMPSGLHADTGHVLGLAVRADVTVTFVGLKRGLLTGEAPACCGALVFADLGVPAAVYAQVPASVERLDFAAQRAALPARPRTAHKGLFGHVLVIGGDAGMPGAPLMAAEAAARSGAGLVTVATRPEHVAAVAARCPSLMVHGVVSGQELEPLLERPTVLVVGPGLGTGPWGEQLLQKAAAAGKPMVLDADALNILAAGRLLRGERRDNWILTPHPGEAARLLGSTAAAVQQARFAGLTALQQRFGGTVILKGAGSLVAGNGPTGLCAYGNPGMASGGMGDVLSGILGGLLAQGLTIGQAARLGVCLHAVAADRAAAEGECGLLATDLLPWLRRLLSGVAA